MKQYVNPFHLGSNIHCHDLQLIFELIIVGHALIYVYSTYLRASPWEWRDDSVDVREDFALEVVGVLGRLKEDAAGLERKN